MSAQKTNVLIVGATGYIGGSILTELLQSPEVSALCISALIRRPEQAAKLEALGVKPVLFEGLDDLEACKNAASENDVVINAASASHDRSATALIKGLALRQTTTSNPTYMVHTSGTSILGDRPYTGASLKDKIWSDVHSDVYNMETTHPERYAQRVTDIAVVETGLKTGVRTYIVVPPTIYGKGTGPFATLSQQIPNLARLARKRGHAVVIEKGEGVWNHVHISDLSRYYLHLFRAVMQQPEWLPSGPRGIFFVESGEHTWMQVSQGIADAMFKRGLVGTGEVKEIGLGEAAEAVTKGDEVLVEITLASNARARADFGRERLGWRAERGDEDFGKHFDEEVEGMMGEFEAGA
ncbi:NAD dependent epimerase/dehydratase family protein [Lentithecium fluviatile CBS 122367]|uniref:NAD dependent epimerase/dehydratase family protein n=1 Tax=Lentithecium fluviatile CBS 122367 TaxID=1168545 RepID=A0A6G1IMG2_9PLEO|nr:NAD dependent epimerase/dehydratase family protein [Lentithecium fluviatile CBS 122367]